MNEPLDESLIRDSICGLELQLIELVENQARAEVQGRAEDAASMQPDIDLLHTQLAQAADIISAGRLDVHGA
jgi:hypothetical protein